MSLLEDHEMWDEKYRPKSIAEYTFHDNLLRNKVHEWIKDKVIPNLLLSGVPGSGKSSLSMILVEELGIDPMDVITINASDENDVDTIRVKVKSFISTYAMGTFKIVRLEEADRLSIQAQDALKAMMEEYKDVSRFIFTCNTENRITGPLKSRLQHFRFAKPNRDDVTEYVATVLVHEKVKFTVPLLDKYVATAYPDIRKIISLLQQNTVDGKLQEPEVGSVGRGEYKFALIDLIERGSWVEARILACAEVAKEEWDDIYRFLYENLDKAPSFSSKEKWEAGIVIIADHLYKHGIVADPEINAAAMFIRLEQV